MTVLAIIILALVLGSLAFFFFLVALPFLVALATVGIASAFKKTGTPIPPWYNPLTLALGGIASVLMLLSSLGAMADLSYWPAAAIGIYAFLSILGFGIQLSLEKNDLEEDIAPDIDGSSGNTDEGRSFTLAFCEIPDPTEQDEEAPSDDPDDDEEFIFCSVALDGSCVTSYYLADDCDIRCGDFVAVPVGRDNLVKRGRVMRVEIHTRATAPYPVEKTKQILSVL